MDHSWKLGKIRLWMFQCVGNWWNWNFQNIWSSKFNSIQWKEFWALYKLTPLAWCTAKSKRSSFLKAWVAQKSTRTLVSRRDRMRQAQSTNDWNYSAFHDKTERWLMKCFLKCLLRKLEVTPPKIANQLENTSTVWKLQNFCVTQILREIKICKSRILKKSAILSHFDALNFDFDEFLQFFKAEIYQSNQI